MLRFIDEIAQSMYCRFCYQNRGHYDKS